MSKSDLMGKREDLVEKMKKVQEEMTGAALENDVKAVIETARQPVSPKLFVTGRIDRKKGNYIAKSLVISAKLEDEIKSYCRGVDLVILNYLLTKGLEQVKQSEAPINIDIADI